VVVDVVRGTFGFLVSVSSRFPDGLKPKEAYDMPHSKSRYHQDLGFTDGEWFLGPGEIVWDVAAQAAIARAAAGQWSVAHVVAANTTNFAVNLTQAILRRSGFGEDLQEQFGGSGIPGSAEYQGRPDTLASMATGQPITPRTAFKVKGFKLIEFDVIYTIGTAALTTHTCRVDQTQYVNNLAPATTVVLASAANGLATATQAQPYVTTVVLPVAQQIYRTLNDLAFWVEVQANAAATTVYNLIGIDCDIEFNFN